MRFHDDWLAARRRLLRGIQEQVLRRLGTEDPGLRLYRQAYDREFLSRWHPSENRELMAAVLKAKVVLGADFHAFSQSQRIHLRILRELPRQRRVTLALEAVESRHQSWVDQFLAGSLSEIEFLKSVNWQESWGFPWSHYQPLFALARRRGMRILALDARHGRRGRDLEARDQHFARLIAREVKRSPERLVYGIVGDLHLASRHLPAKIFASSQNRILRSDLVTILQNSEHLYFRLARKQREDQVEVMRAGANRYCVLSSPPWVKWQSYLLHLESTMDTEFGEWSYDASDHLQQYLQVLARDLQTEAPPVDALTVMTPESRQHFRGAYRGLGVRERSLVRSWMDRDRSFFLVENQTLYFSRRSLNHVAAVAGLVLQAHLSGRRRSAWRFPGDFLAAIWLEAMSFCLSKFINHRRKPESIEGLRLQLEGARANRLQREVLLLALGQRLKEVAPYQAAGKGLPKSSVAGRHRSVFVYAEASRILGGMLGERIYRAVRRRHFDRQDLQAMLREDVFGKGFARRYESWLRRLGGDGRP